LKSLSYQEYRQLVEGATVLEQDRRGYKVLQTDDGNIVKLFRRKRLISSALIRSYALRFVDNARKLQNLGFDTVDIVDTLSCKPIRRTLVVYRPLPGQTLRAALRDGKDPDRLLSALAGLLARLHDRGVFFRSIHFNNLIVAEESENLGLIDVADLKVWPFSLPRQVRLRNFRHLVRYGVDREAINAFGADRFVAGYLRESTLSSADDGFRAGLIETLTISDKP